MRSKRMPNWLITLALIVNSIAQVVWHLLTLLVTLPFILLSPFIPIFIILGFVFAWGFLYNVVMEHWVAATSSLGGLLLLAWLLRKLVLERAANATADEKRSPREIELELVELDPP